MKVRLRFKKDLLKNKPFLVGAFLTLLLLVIIAITTGYYYVTEDSKKKALKSPTGPPVVAVPEPAGGNPGLLTDYYQQALDAWKAGDKEKAKSLAQRGLDVNDQLTEAQKQQVPNQIDVVYDLFYIKEGQYGQ